MVIRSPRTAEDLLRLSWKPVRKGIRTEKQIHDLFTEIVRPEIAYQNTKEAPFERILYGEAEIYSDQGRVMEEWQKMFLSLGIQKTQADYYCKQLKRDKQQWEADQDK